VVTLAVRAIGNLKRWLLGTHHGVGRNQLQAYLDEFVFRHNRRKQPMANESGAIRAGVFVRFHPSKSEQGLLMYSESLAGSTDPDESRKMMFRLKSSAGWRR
jgi:hypothetical protein